nr:hypothetical protein [Escherichia coli]
MALGSEPEKSPRRVGHYLMMSFTWSPKPPAICSLPQWREHSGAENDQRHSAPAN